MIDAQNRIELLEKAIEELETNIVTAQEACVVVIGRAEQLEKKVKELEEKIECQKEACLVTIEHFQDVFIERLDKLRGEIRKAFKMQMVHQTEMERNFVLPSFFVTHPEAMETLRSVNKALGAEAPDSPQAQLYRMLSLEDSAERIDRIFLEADQKKSQDKSP